MRVNESISSEKLDIRRLIEFLRNKGKPSADCLSRELCVTPYLGNYGPAGLVIAVNGSPPRGVIVTEGNFAAFVAAGGRAREIKKPEHQEIVWRFVAWHKRIQALVAQIDAPGLAARIEATGYIRTVAGLAEELGADPRNVMEAIWELIGHSLSGATVSVTHDGGGQTIAGVILQPPDLAT